MNCSQGPGLSVCGISSCTCVTGQSLCWECLQPPQPLLSAKKVKQQQHTCWNQRKAPIFQALSTAGRNWRKWWKKRRKCLVICWNWIPVREGKVVLTNRQQNEPGRNWWRGKNKSESAKECITPPVETEPQSERARSCWLIVNKMNLEEIGDGVKIKAKVPKNV